MIISSIDIKRGKAVQLIGGKKKILEKDNPIKLAKEFNVLGEIAVIDLDSAFNEGHNLNLVKSIASFTDCRVGGGIRSIKKAKQVLSYGASKVILGTKIFNGGKLNTDFLKKFNRIIGKNRLIIAIDSIDKKIAINGWRKKTDFFLLKVIKKLEPYTSEFLFTNIKREGKMRGTNIKLIKEIRKSTSKKLVVAGGVKNIEEIKELSRIGVDIQLGMALYKGKIKLSNAFIESLDWEKMNNLIPTIVRDCNGQVLMLAYSTKQSLKKTFKTGKMWYYSRSRDKLWMKGETSGNIQELIKIRADCDKDSLLATVKQNGHACHLNRYSCFEDKIFYLQDLYKIVSERLKNPTNSSYTASLTQKKVRAKIKEEVFELINASGKEEIIWEAADILYFLTVLIQKSEVTFSEIYNELRRRRWK